MTKTETNTTVTAATITRAQIIAIRDNGRTWLGKAKLCRAALLGETNAHDRVAYLHNSHIAVANGTY
jgi:hypothetical protein